MVIVQGLQCCTGLNMVVSQPVFGRIPLSYENRTNERENWLLVTVEPVEVWDFGNITGHFRRTCGIYLESTKTSPKSITTCKPLDLETLRFLLIYAKKISQTLNRMLRILEAQWLSQRRPYSVTHLNMHGVWLGVKLRTNTIKTCD